MNVVPEEYTPTLDDDMYVTMTCRNHTNLRWTRKNPEKMKGMISNNPQLIFKGEVGKSNPSYDGGSVRSVMRMALEDKTPGAVENAIAYILNELKRGYVFECDCPMSDLYYIKED